MARLAVRTAASNGFVTITIGGHPKTLRAADGVSPALTRGSVAGTLEGVPEPSPERVPDLVVQQRVNGQRRTLEQSGLQI